MASSLITIAAFDNLPEAEWAQTRLAQAQIFSSLDNGTLVGWFWQLNNAVGGIKLQVPAADADEASQLLDQSESKSKAHNACPQCREALEPEWEVCWRCGEDFSDPATRDAAQPLPSITQSVDQHITSVWQALGVTVSGLIMFCAGGLTGLFTWLACLAIGRAVFSVVRLPAAAAVDEANILDADRASNPRAESSANDTARRAGMAAMIGLLYFPPLSAYAVWKAMQIVPSAKSLSPRGRVCRNAALGVGIMTMVMWAWLFTALYFAVAFRHFSPFQYEHPYHTSPWSLTD